MSPRKALRAVAISFVVTTAPSFAAMPRPPAPGTVQRALPNRIAPKLYTLVVTISTGDDDLRSESEARLTLYDHTGNKEFNYCVLKPSGGQGWGNSSSHVVICSAPISWPSLNELRQGGYAELTYDGTPHGVEGGFQTYDNWTVTRVNASALDTTNNHSECVLEASGKPLARMTGDTKKFTIIARC